MESKRKFLLLFLVISAILVALLWYIIGKVRNNSSPVHEPARTSEEERAAQRERSNLINAIQQLAASDRDLDGLNDTEEKKYGTNPESVDTDGDGLLDKDELQVYQTDPLKPDSDGDGKTDGYEVRRGMNPKKKN